MKPVIPSTSNFIVMLILFYWGVIILDFPIVITIRDVAYTAVLLLILFVDSLNKRRV